jgi:hypothetical protein
LHTPEEQNDQIELWAIASSGFKSDAARRGITAANFVFALFSDSDNEVAPGNNSDQRYTAINTVDSFSDRIRLNQDDP